MRILFLGDVVGPAATAALARSFDRIRREHRLDVVAVNADNTEVRGAFPFGGSGTSTQAVRRLMEAGADIVSTGSHLLDAPDAAAVVEPPGVLRPINVAIGAGRGDLTLDGGSARFVHLAGTTSLLDAEDPLDAWARLAVSQPPPVIVHVVAEPFEVQVLAHALDGTVAAVLGTMSHLQVRHPSILPSGTALVEDVGYVGPVGGIGGFAPEHFIADARSEDPPDEPYRLVDGPLRAQGAVVELDGGSSAVELFEEEL